MEHRISNWQTGHVDVCRNSSRKDVIFVNSLLVSILSEDKISKN